MTPADALVLAVICFAPSLTAVLLPAHERGMARVRGRR